jgi:hypothetical protein
VETISFTDAAWIDKTDAKFGDGTQNKFQKKCGAF